MSILLLNSRNFIRGGFSMAHNDEARKEGFSSNSILRWLGRLILVAIILGVTSFLTPGFSISGLWWYLIAAVIICLVDYFVETLMGVGASPFGKGIKGFFIAVVIIYFAQFIIPTMSVTIIGAILASLVIGVLAALLPVKVI